jgi:hypothetical protein
MRVEQNESTAVFSDYRSIFKKAATLRATRGRFPSSTHEGNNEAPTKTGNQP